MNISIPSFHLFPAADWDLCFTGDLKFPLVLQPEVWRRSCVLASPFPCPGDLPGARLYTVRCKIRAVHSNPRGAETLSLWNPISYSNIGRIRALQVQGRLGSGSVWYRLEACAQLQSHLPLGAIHSPKGNACLGMSSCCCAAVLHVSAVLWTPVFADVWIIPWQMVGFTLLYARMCLRLM